MVAASESAGHPDGARDAWDGSHARDEPFECAVALPGWRLHLVQLVRRADRDLGNVMDTAVRGAAAHVLRAHPDAALESDATLVAIRAGLDRLGIDVRSTPPCSETVIRSILESRSLARGSLAWELLMILIAKSHAPWSALDRARLEPPLVFRSGRPGETLQTASGEQDCEGLPVLADGTGVKASPWALPAPDSLDGCERPVFVCYVPREVFRSIDPKSHMGRAIWLTWAYAFVFSRTFGAPENAAGGGSPGCCR